MKINNNLSLYNPQILKQKNQKTNFKSNEQNNNFVMIKTPVSPIMNFLIASNISFPILQKQKNNSKVWDTFSILLLGVTSTIYAPHKHYIEIKKNKSKDKSVKEYLISKQIREAISLSAGSLLLADGINNKSYDKKTKPWLIGLSITAWSASIINNLTAYYNYKKENRQEIVE